MRGSSTLAWRMLSSVTATASMLVPLSTPFKRFANHRGDDPAGCHE
jgi:hypothetical protein